MLANRSLGNPTDRDDNGGLRNRVRYGRWIEVPLETTGDTTIPYRARAPHSIQTAISLEDCARVPRIRSGTGPVGQEGEAHESEHALTGVSRRQGQPEVSATDSSAVL
jgi:hypothetical protein